MGEVALDSTEDDQTNDENQTEDLQVDAAAVVETEEKPETEVEEFEIVNSLDDGSPPKDSNIGIRKRINKLNTKVEVAVEGKASAESDNAILRQKVELMQLALDQREQKATALEIPDPLDFEGTKDPKYIEKFNAYSRSLYQTDMDKHVSSQQPAEPQRDRELEERQTAHYGRAVKLGVKDYDEVEDKAIDILGKGTVNQLIKASDNSQNILYYLGKNPEKAKELGELIKTDAVKGVLKLGELGAGLKVQKKARTSAPNPDKELAGAHPGARRTKGKGPTFE